MLDNEAGAYRVLPGGAAYCGAVVPHDGFEVVRVQLRPWLALERAYAFIESHLQGIGRPVRALCGMELRIPRALSIDQWSSFNVPYLDRLRKWELMFGELSGVCRSNIALALHAPDATSLCAFSYTAPASAKGMSFLLSGQADIDAKGKIIAEGDTSPPAMQQRARFTIDSVGARLAELGLSWQDTKQIALFHAVDIPDLWGPTLLGAMGDAIRDGVLVYRARPPIVGAEVELEARAVRDVFVATS